MNTRAQVDVPSVTIALIIAVVILIIMTYFIRTYIGAPVTLTFNSEAIHIQYSRCVIGGRLLGTGTSCPISTTDADGDCAPDYCDPCILITEGKGKIGLELEAHRGSNLCDADGDNMPDACDTQPANPLVITCASTSSDGRCNKISEAFKFAPPKCVKKQFSPV
ncbi:hypothetical protein HY641_04015 [Candidatus Woesearchaeota archaeon]|nr:hypothetical protein [Candidatus Woesearchaeota archaeon]